MDACWIWWIIALGLVIAEISTGTFYMIAVASGFAIAGLLAYLGAGTLWQTVSAALICTVSLAAVYLWNQRQARPNVQANFSNDIGQTVRVVSWLDERHGRVSYRGAEWDAELAAGARFDASRKAWQIVEIAGNCLIIE